MIQVWQAEHSATVIRLDSRFAHDDGLPMPQDWNYGTDRLGDASIVTVYRVEGFERYGLLTAVDFRL
jgi:hypothetical protein